MKMLAPTLSLAATVLAFTSQGAFAAGLVEGASASVSKSYVGGDWIRLECDDAGQCKICGSAEGKRFDVPVDPEKLGVAFTLDRISLFVAGPDRFSFVTGVACSDRDIELAGESPEVTCEVSTLVTDGLVRDRGAVHIMPLSQQELYRSGP